MCLPPSTVCAYSSQCFSHIMRPRPLHSMPLLAFMDSVYCVTENFGAPDLLRTPFLGTPPTFAQYALSIFWSFGVSAKAVLKAAYASGPSFSAMCLKRSKDRLQSLSKSVDVETTSESNFLLQPRHMQKPLEVLAFFALEPVAEVLMLGSDDGDPSLLLREPLGRPSFFFSPSRPPSRPSPPPPLPSKATQRSSAPSPSSDAVRHGAAGASPSSANMAGVPGNKKCL